MRCQLQVEASECGLACLAMMATHLGHRTDVPTLRRRFPVGLKGTTLSQLIRFAGALALAARPLRIELDELERVQTPCILHWNLNHFVVLAEVKRGVRGVRAKILDPARGELQLSLKELSRGFTGVALELSPTTAFKPRDETRSIKVSELLGQVIGLKRSLLQVLLLAVALEVFAITAPFFLQWVVDGAVVSADRDLLSLLVLGFGLLLGVQTAVGLARSWVLLTLATNLSFQWTSNVFGHLLRLPMDWFEKRHLGDITSRFGAIGAIQRTLTAAAIESVLDGVMAVAMLAMMLLYSTSLTAVVLVAVLLYGLLRWAAFRPFRRASEEMIVLAAKEQSHFLESLRGVQAVKLSGVEDERRAAWLNLVVDRVNRGLATERMAIGFQIANTFVFGVENLLIVWMAAQLVMDGSLTLGMMFAFVAYKGQFTGRVSALIGTVVSLRMLRLHGERLADIVLEKPELDAAQLVLHDRASTLPAAFEVRDVSFRYGCGEPWVLRNCSLSIEAGESVAIIGPSGCGKTTLLKLMVGLLTPEEGEVRYGGLPLTQIGLPNYRQETAVVMQNDQLFAGSLAENIALFDRRPRQEFVELCAGLAGLHDEILQMPMGYHTLVGDMGTVLSGGQKQRLLLARALYRRPKVLFLDEATSHLDVAKEREINAAIKQLRITRVIIAHRPETIAMADRVLRIVRGDCLLSAGSAPRTGSSRPRATPPSSDSPALPSGSR